LRGIPECPISPLPNTQKTYGVHKFPLGIQNVFFSFFLSFVFGSVILGKAKAFGVLVDKKWDMPLQVGVAFWFHLYSDESLAWHGMESLGFVHYHRKEGKLQLEDQMSQIAPATS
jgi:hypothetical protein